MRIIKRIVLCFAVLFILLFTTAICNAGEKWFQVGEWYTGFKIADSTMLNNNTETFKAPSSPWGFQYLVEKIDKTLPMSFNIVVVPTNNIKYDQEPVCIAASGTMKGGYRIHNKSPENYLMVNSINCRWSIGVFKIVNPKK